MGGNTVVVVNNNLPDLFAFGAPDYNWWCCMSCWCQGIALKKMGDWLEQSNTAWDPTIWILTILLQVCRGVFFLNGYCFTSHGRFGSHGYVVSDFKYLRLYILRRDRDSRIYDIPPTSLFHPKIWFFGKRWNELSADYVL